MHFPNLTEIGQHYAAEEGTAGVRQAFMDNYAAALVQKKMELAAANDEATKTQVATGSVAQRAAFFAAGGGTQQKATAQTAVKRLERIVVGLTEKLRRQGAVFNPNGTINWAVTAAQVVYDHTAAQQGLTQLRPARGLLHTDQACTVKFDTRDMVTAFGGKGWAIYVMSPTGNIHASAHSVGHRHHSSLLAGGNVAGAGEMRVSGGKVMEISNKSGHYAPSAAHLLQVLHVLNKRGVDLFNTKLMFKTATGQERFPSVTAFLASLPAKGFETDYEFSKMMAYLNHIGYAHFTAQAAAKGWRWGLPADFAPPSPAAGGRGVVRIVDGSQVSHREVRKWLKGLGHALPQLVQSGMGR